MNAPARTFSAKPAVRESVPLLTGIMGPSGGGKTFSALRLATGIQAVTGGDIYGIDTEARRMLHYADRFKFKHVQFDAPFGSRDYLAAIRQSVSAGAGVVIVDSMSHEHSGPGGMLDFQEQELERLAGTDYAKRERMKMLAWQKPKAARREMIDGLLQLNANFIFCFRAKETAKPIKNPQTGKNEVVPMGFMPIAGEEMVFEMTMNCLLLPHADGVPTWRSDSVGERMMMKLPEQFRGLFADSRPLDEETGKALAEWARGGAVPASNDSTALFDAARAAARAGRASFDAYWKALAPTDRPLLRPILAELKGLAEQPDAAAELSPGDDLGSADTVDPVSAARQRGADAYRSGMSRKAVPPEFRNDDRRAEADAWLAGHDAEREAQEPVSGHAA